MVRVYQVFGERVHLFVLVGEVCLGYSRARYRRPSPGFDPAHPRFSIGIVWIGGTVESTYTVYNDHNLHNPALSQSKVRKSMKSRKSWTPGSGGVNYGTLLSSSGGCTPITCGSPTRRSMPQPL